MWKQASRAVLVLAVGVLSSRCGGGSSAPSSPSGTAGSAVTVTISATNGNLSYAPNPVQTAGQPLLFMNNDRVTHHIVMDDGSVDFGTLAAGASSVARAVSGGGNYHCTIHPSMVGSVNGAVAPTPQPGSGDGY